MNQAEFIAKRDAVYASLLKYASETVPLRERAIDRMVLAALIGTTESAPLKSTEVRANLPLGSTGEGVRLELVQDSLRRLESARTVDERIVRDKRKYFLTPQGYSELDRVLASSNDLFEAAFKVAFDDFDPNADLTQAKEVFRRFVCKAFELLGRDIASSLTGRAGQDILLGRVECEVAIKYALGGASLAPEAIESVRARCRLFLSSQDPAAAQLKYYLTQGFYLAQLFLVDSGPFTPLAEEAFKGAVFYLDTNVILVGLLQREGTEGDFLEFLDVARTAGAELRVTRETINEVRSVLADRRAELISIMEGIPLALAERTKDRIHRAFFEELDHDPRLTPEEFFDRMLDVAVIIQNQWGIPIEDMTADEILRGRNVDQLLQMLSKHAIAGRGWGKAVPVLRHDAAHYVLVQDDRRGSPKTWFLTRDRTMMSASAELSSGGSPVTFDFIAFVSSLSPFVRTAKGSTVVSNVLSWVLAHQINAVEGLFEARELVLMGEMHADVMATPPDQLVLAFDFARNSVLHGRQYSRQDTPEMSLALRKFLASSAQERDQAAEAERARLEREVHEQAERWEREESARRSALIERDAAREESARLAKENLSISGEYRAESLRASRMEKGVARLEALMWVGLAEGGLALVIYSKDVAAFGSEILSGRRLGSSGLVVALVGGALYVGCLIAALRLVEWSSSKKDTWLVVAILLLLLMSGFSGVRSAGGVADWSTLFLLLLTGVGGWLWRRRESSASDGTGLSKPIQGAEG